MKAKGLSSYLKTSAVGQVVGELENMGQRASIADIAAFLGCTKETAKKYLDKSLYLGKVVRDEVPYRPNRTMFVYRLGEKGKALFNSTLWLSAKKTILEARGII